MYGLCPVSGSQRLSSAVPIRDISKGKRIKAKRHARREDEEEENYDFEHQPGFGRIIEDYNRGASGFSKDDKKKDKHRKNKHDSDDDDDLIRQGSSSPIFRNE